MRFSLTYLFGLLAVLTACISSRSLLQHEHIVKRDLTPESVNGSYSNASDSLGHLTFYSILAAYHSRVLKHSTDILKPDEISTVQLYYDGDRELEILFFRNDTLQAATTARVKNKDDVLYFKRHFFLIPIPFAFFVYDEERLALVSDLHGNIHLFGKGSTTVWVLMAGGQDYSRHESFKKQ